jgi:hypothetical protein
MTRCNSRTLAISVVFAIGLSMLVYLGWYLTRAYWRMSAVMNCRGAVCDATWDRNTNRIYVATLNRGVFEFSAEDLPKLTLRRRVLVDLEPVSVLAVDAGRELLCVGEASRDGLFEMRTASGDLLWSRPLLGGTVGALAFCGTDKWLIAGGHDGLSDWGNDGDIVISDPSSGDVLAALRACGAMPWRRIAACRDRNAFAVLFRDGSIRGWEFRREEDNIELSSVPQLEINGARWLSMDQESSHLWILQDESCLVFNWDNQESTEVQLPHDVRLDRIECLDSGRLLGIVDGSLIVFRIAEGRAVVDEVIPTRWILGCVASPDSRFVVVYGGTRIGVIEL